MGQQSSLRLLDNYKRRQTKEANIAVETKEFQDDQAAQTSQRDLNERGVGSSALMMSEKEYMEVAVGGSTIAFSEEGEDEGKPGQG